MDEPRDPSMVAHYAEHHGVGAAAKQFSISRSRVSAILAKRAASSYTGPTDETAPGWSGLTDRQREILALRSSGRSWNTIAETLDVTSTAVHLQYDRAIAHLAVVAAKQLAALDAPTTGGAMDPEDVPVGEESPAADDGATPTPEQTTEPISEVTEDTLNPRDGSEGPEAPSVQTEGSECHPETSDGDGQAEQTQPGGETAEGGETGQEPTSRRRGRRRSGQ